MYIRACKKVGLCAYKRTDSMGTCAIPTAVVTVMTSYTNTCAYSAGEEWSSFLLILSGLPNVWPRQDGTTQ